MYTLQICKLKFSFDGFYIRNIGYREFVLNCYIKPTATIRDRIEIKSQLVCYIDLTPQTNGSTCDLHNNDIQESPGYTSPGLTPQPGLIN